MTEKNHEDESDDGGLSLDELSQAFAQAMAKGNAPYDDSANSEESDSENNTIEDRSASSAQAFDEESVEDENDEDKIPTNPTTILESILFVGTPDHQPIKATKIASLMRGVREDELDDLVAELNESYKKQGSAFRIISESGGFRMVLHHDFECVRNNFYGEIKEARLNQAAIDTLSIVAYRQPIDKEEIEKIRGRNSSSVLSQLVRRALLQVNFSEGKPRKKTYTTTDRFLKVYHLDSIEDLPQQLEFED